MKRVLIAGFLGVFALGMFSCGHGTCDAYNQSDYTQYKKDNTQKIEMIQELSETQK
jgi:hypothetical protein